MGFRVRGFSFSGGFGVVGFGFRVWQVGKLLLKVGLI